MRNNRGLAKVGDLLANLNPPGPEPEQPQVFAPPQKSLERLSHQIERHEASNVIQLPLWFEPERGTPNSFLRSALFAAIESKDRKYIQGITLASSKDVSIKFTGQQLN